MSHRLIRFAGVVLSGAILVVGCGGEPEKPKGELEPLSPGMDQMKQDMMKAYQTKSIGKAAPGGDAAKK